jgi:coenzyme F420-reducing hydrogenase delta subunit/NAD-dependent dihydropyrimidine dehydrogenase PreA subunit
VAGARVQQAFDLVAVADLRPADNGGRPVVDLKAGPQGALQYDDVWLLPSLTSRPGVLAAGAARGNSEYRQALADGLAAARRVHALLGGRRLEFRDDAATVDPDKCVLCLTCVRVCPHGAVHVDEEAMAATVSPLSCQRCGLCTAECPAQAITLPGFTDSQIAARVGKKPRLTVFACENSAIPAAEAAGISATGPAVELVRVPCAGKVDPLSVLGALERGAEKVLILGCHPDSCRYLQGSGRAEKRARRISAMLAKAGFDGSRVEFRGIASVEPQRMKEWLTPGRPKAKAKAAAT